MKTFPLRKKACGEIQWSFKYDSADKQLAKFLIVKLQCKNNLAR